MLQFIIIHRTARRHKHIPFPFLFVDTQTCAHRDSEEDADKHKQACGHQLAGEDADGMRTCGHQLGGLSKHDCLWCLQHQFDHVRIKVVPTDGVGPALYLKPREVYMLGYKDSK